MRATVRDFPSSNSPMLRLVLLLLLALLVAAGCGGGDDDDGGTWGGYSEREARDILADPDVRRQIVQNAPGDPTANPYDDLLPTKEEAEEADLRRVTVQGQEAWEYSDEENNFCVYVWEDEEFDSFATQVSACVAD